MNPGEHREVRSAGLARRDEGRARAPRSRHRCGWTLLLLAAAAPAAGCLGRTAPNPFEEGAAPRAITIEVENNNFNEATLRAMARMERRIGVVTGNGRQTFTIPWTTVDDLRVRIDILAGDRFTTNRVTVGPGEAVFLTVQNPLYRSLLSR